VVLHDLLPLLLTLQMTKISTHEWRLEQGKTARTDDEMVVRKKRGWTQDLLGRLALLNNQSEQSDHVNNVCSHSWDRINGIHLLLQRIVHVISLNKSGEFGQM
jgi:hypothetical protein